MLRGNRLGVKMGERVTVRGSVALVEHPPAFVGGVFVPGWVEVRAEE